MTIINTDYTSDPELSHDRQTEFPHNLNKRSAKHITSFIK